ncbi:MAG: class IV adenylate cyclase [Conexivisphaera sp.]|jgi:adenylate cyclase class 2
MKEELEVKIRVDDPGRVIRAIENMGGRLTSSVVEEDVYLAHPCRDFASTDEALRMRRSDGVAELTYKGPRAMDYRGAKSRIEVTVPVGDPEAAIELLRHLGFAPVATVRKRRSYYRTDSAIISVDSVSGLGDFVEVEAIDPGLGVQGLQSIVRELGLEWRPVEETYLEMILRRGGADR